MSVPVGLNPIGELGELLVSHELAPASEEQKVELLANNILQTEE
jgi:hypothetical protein